MGACDWLVVYVTLAQCQSGENHMGFNSWSFDLDFPIDAMPTLAFAKLSLFHSRTPM